MRYVWIGLGAIVGCFGLPTVDQIVASESGEVLVLETVDAEGSARETRIRVVDDAGAVGVHGDGDRAGALPIGWTRAER